MPGLRARAIPALARAVLDGKVRLCRALDLTPGKLEERAESWRPWRAYAAAALWQTGRAQSTLRAR